jgi:uncharacterized membrane protein HdeD (DUF308 family)
MEAWTRERDGPGAGWLVLIGLFDIVVAVGLLVLAGRWPAVLLVAVAAVLGCCACLLASRFTGAGGGPRLVTPRTARGKEWE